MRYVLKQKFWSWGDDFTIKNADGQDAFFVDGKAFSWGDKLSFQDMSGKELAFIRQKLLSWGPTYEIDVHGKLVAVVKKNCSRSCAANSLWTCPDRTISKRKAVFWITNTPSSARAARWPVSANAGSPGPTLTAWTSLQVRMTC